jgi:hypothetical protein
MKLEVVHLLTWLLNMLTARMIAVVEIDTGEAYNVP